MLRSMRLPPRRLPFVMRAMRTSAAAFKPAVAYAESVPDYHHPPTTSYTQSTLRPADRPLLELPVPLPADVTAPPRSLQAELFQTTDLIDRVSMISICLRRLDNVPRAYQILLAMLKEADQGKPLPSADVWGNVTRGVAEIGKTEGLEGPPADKAMSWRARAERLMWEWEEVSGAEPRLQPVLARDGIKVYRGWFAGSVASASPLDPLVPYLRDGTLSVASLVEGLKQAELPVAFKALVEAADAHALPELREQVDVLQGQEQARREVVAREVVDEVAPVLESPRERKLSVKSIEAQSDMPQARFAINNLRAALDKITGAELAHSRQVKLERAAYEAAEKELAHAAKMMAEAGTGAAADAVTLQRRQLQAWMYGWFGELKAKLQADIAAMQERQRAAGDAAHAEVSPPKWSSSAPIKESTLELYLSLLPADKLALITILELMRMVGSGGITDGMKTLRGLTAVGKAVEQEYRAETIRNVAGADSAEWMQTLDPQSQKPSRSLVSGVWSRLGKKLEEGAAPYASSANDDLRAVWTPPWSQMAQMSVGSYLVAALLEVAKVTQTTKMENGEIFSETHNAFAHAYEYVRGKKLGIIKLHSLVAKRLANDSMGPVIQPRHLPMLVPPKQWTSYNTGAYLHNRVSIMRFKQAQEQKLWLRAASDRGDLEPVFHGLDVLSSTPWNINRAVFDVVLAAWNAGDAIADIPAREDKADVVLPDKPDPSDHDPRRRAIYVEQFKAATLQQRKNHGERCKYNYMLEIARAFLHDTFYIPHNMDFRGRAYPIPPHLSPVGDDLCRGLLTFGVKKPLGATGLKWLRIHLANVYGYDKASFEERSRFAVDHEADIFDSADDPLGGKRWWLQAEDPWQCLAACVDLAAALRADQPELYESSLPVHQDGTCNGMQHYAALGGDVRGAKAVNLENGDRPADIYSGVADLVNKSIEQDRRDNVPLALLLEGPLGRKVVKQTVMTTVYGVTFIGARDQIAKQLIARGGLAPEHVWHVSAYIAHKVLGCIGDLFSGARAIQDWLTTSARLIARSIPADRVDEAARPVVPKASRAAKPPAAKKNRVAKELMSSVIWTTPLGLPVVQPYRKLVKKQVMTALQTVYIQDPNASAEVSPQKQATAFPPNFIHSLDATHMLLTAVECRNKGVTFASVHDSYWTHASTVDTMAEYIRDCFIRLHSQNLIGELRDEFLHRYGDYMIPIDSAKTISRSVAKKRSKNERMAVTASPQATTPLAADDTAALPADAIPPPPEGSAMEAAAAATPEASVGDLAERLDDMDVADEDSAEAVAIPADDELIANAPIHTVHGQRFVRFRDVFPAPPRRGAFEVERIRESAYFFS